MVTELLFKRQGSRHQTEQVDSYELNRKPLPARHLTIATISPPSTQVNYLT